jgi:uncharacterized membrane protein
MRWRFLTDESRSWVDQNLISETQRDEIMRSYDVPGSFLTAILALGVTMIGLGVLSFIAANWKTLPNEVKIALIVGSYTVSVLGAYFCAKRGWGVMSDTFLLLSGFLLLGGLALISQIFHLQRSLIDLLATWLLIYLPTFLLARSVAIYTLYESVGLVYMNMLYIDSPFWRSGNFHGLATLIMPYQAPLLLILLVTAAWWSWRMERDSDSAPRSMLRTVFAGGSTRKIFLSNFFILDWFTWLCIINSTRESFLPYVVGILVIGTLISLSAWILDASDLDLQGLLCVGLAGFALTLRVVWAGWNHDYSDDSQRFLFRQVLASAALGAYLLWRIAQQRRNIAFSVFLFCVILARWYFDMFYNFISKSLFFTLGGVLLLLTAFACHRWNRKRKRSGKKPEADSESTERSGGDAHGL